MIPHEKDTINAPVPRTRKAVLRNDDNKTGGMGGESPAFQAEAACNSLEGPILRIAPPDTPVPFSTPLEEFFLPKVSDIVAGAKKLAAY